MESVPRALSLGDEYVEEIERPHNVVTQPNGVIIIEKLDTPATRREKNLRRKAEKPKMAVQAGEAISAGSSNTVTFQLSVQSGPRQASPKPNQCITKDATYLLPLDSYFWWPAVVHTPTSSNIPRNIYQAWLDKTAKWNIQLFIVQFYDKQNSWWVFTFLAYI